MSLQNEERGVALRETRSTPGGRPVTIRRLAPGDEEGLRAMFRRLSRETIYRRFHMPYPRVPEPIQARISGHTNGGSLIAIAGGGVVGHAMYAGETLDEAEVAIVVEDGWQSKGIGKTLLAELAREAAGRGVEAFTAAALGENRRVLNLVDAVFAGVRYTAKGGAYDIRMPLKGLRSPAEPQSKLRSAA